MSMGFRLFESSFLFSVPESGANFDEREPAKSFRSRSITSILLRRRARIVKPSGLMVKVCLMRSLYVGSTSSKSKFWRSMEVARRASCQANGLPMQARTPLPKGYRPHKQSFAEIQSKGYRKV
jgi:hypothetical protein